MITNFSGNEFALIRQCIEEYCGIVVEEEKAYLLESKLSRLLIEYGMTSFEELYDMLQHRDQDQTLLRKMIDATANHETYWFRDTTPWSAFWEKLLPEYIEEIRSGKRQKVRIWSAACSTGQEPYSAAMCIDRYLEEKNISDISLAQFEFLATDISPAVIKTGKSGRYDNISMNRGLDKSYRDRYFRQEGRTWILDEKIRGAVDFQVFNLQDDMSFLGCFDIIFCRYVTIYFSYAMKQQVLHEMSKVLTENGVLFLGNSEIFLEYKLDYCSEELNNGLFYRARRNEYGHIGGR